MILYGVFRFNIRLYFLNLTYNSLIILKDFACHFPGEFLSISIPETQFLLESKSISNA